MVNALISDEGKTPSAARVVVAAEPPALPLLTSLAP